MARTGRRETIRTFASFGAPARPIQTRRPARLPCRRSGSVAWPPNGSRYAEVSLAAQGYGFGTLVAIIRSYGDFGAPASSPRDALRAATDFSEKT